MSENKIKTLIPQSVQSFVEDLEVGETISIALIGITPASVRTAITRACEGNKKAYTTKIFGDNIHVTRHF